MGRYSGAGYLPLSGHVVAYEAGTELTCQYRVWDARVADDHDTAVLRGAAAGVSESFRVTTGPLSGPAGIPEGLKSFRIRPGRPGMLRFENWIPGVVEAPVFAEDGKTALQGSGFVAQVSVRNTLVPNDPAVMAGSPVPFGVGDRAGIWEAGVQSVTVVSNVAAGLPAEVQVVVWESAMGATLAEAAGRGSRVGWSSKIKVIVGGDTSPAQDPVPLAGLTSFSLQRPRPGILDMRRRRPGESSTPIQYIGPPDYRQKLLTPPWVAQLFVGRTPGDLLPSGKPLPFGTGEDAGYWVPPDEGRVVVTGHFAGEEVWAAMRVWNGAEAATYEEAILKTAHGASDAERVHLGGWDAEVPPHLSPASWIFPRPPHYVAVEFNCPAPVLNAQGQPLADTNYVAQLYTIPFQGPGLPLGNPAPLRAGPGPVAGTWKASGDDVYEIDVPVGCCPQLQVRVWDRRRGETFDDAVGSPRVVSQTFFVFGGRPEVQTLEAYQLGEMRMPVHAWPAVRHWPAAGTLVRSEVSPGQPLAEPGFVGQYHYLVGARSSDEYAAFERGEGGRPVGPIRPVLTEPVPGVWDLASGTDIEFPGAENANPLAVQLRVWEISRGSNFEEAVRNGSRFGIAPRHAYTVNDIFLANPPPAIIPSPFSLVGRRFQVPVGAGPGLRLIGHPAANGAVTGPADLLRDPLTGTTIFLFDPLTQSYRAHAYYGTWEGTGRASITPGEAFFVYNPGRAEIPLIFDGARGALPPLTRPTGKPRFQTRVNTFDHVAAFEDLTGLAPRDGDALYTFETGRWRIASFDFGAWTETPHLDPGTACFIRLVPQP